MTGTRVLSWASITCELGARLTEAVTEAQLNVPPSFGCRASTWEVAHAAA